MFPNPEVEKSLEEALQILNGQCFEPELQHEFRQISELILKWFSTHSRTLHHQIEQ
jgi:hypothetical protein